jgi:hypothetical protein
MIDAGSKSLSQDLTLDLPSADNLLVKARTKYIAMCKAGADEVRCAMDLGYVLIEVKAKLAPKRGWQGYVKEHIGVSKTVANECIRLARHHDVIERHLGKSDLDGSAVHSIRAALRLIREPSGATETKLKVKTVPPALAVMWAKASPDERRAALTERGFEKAITEFPADWLDKLNQRFAKQSARWQRSVAPIDQPTLLSVVRVLADAVNCSAADPRAAGEKLQPILNVLMKRGDDAGLWGLLGIPNTKPAKPALQAA